MCDWRKWNNAIIEARDRGLAALLGGNCRPGRAKLVLFV